MRKCRPKGVNKIRAPSRSRSAPAVGYYIGREFGKLFSGAANAEPLGGLPSARCAATLSGILVGWDKARRKVPQIPCQSVANLFPFSVVFVHFSVAFAVQFCNNSPCGVSLSFLRGVLSWALCSLCVVLVAIRPVVSACVCSVPAVGSIFPRCVLAFRVRCFIRHCVRPALRPASCGVKVFRPLSRHVGSSASCQAFRLHPCKRIGRLPPLTENRPKRPKGQQ